MNACGPRGTRRPPARASARRRLPAVVATALLGVALLSGACTSGGDTDASVRAGTGESTRTPSAKPRSTGPARTLVLYDSTGPFADLGELYTIQAANLLSHFGGWNAHPVGRYTAGEARRYDLVVYVGSTYDEPLPAAFLADVAAGKTQVLWLHNNIWQLLRQQPRFAARTGIAWQEFDRAAVAEVRYKGTALTRDVRNSVAGIGRLRITAAAKVKPVATAVRPDGSTFPWGVRAGALTYLGEMPFTYVSPDDRYLALTDLLFDLLAPTTRIRHRALVRLEDVGPTSDPAQLRAIADYLYSRRVPFSVATFVDYQDPEGLYEGGKPARRRLSEAPEVVAALKYMTERGGTLIMHGYTHAHTGHNPYGVSGDDFEFYRAHVGRDNKVVLDGPVPGDSAGWALGRVDAARREWVAAGFRPPDIFEFPHYVASATDYLAISADNFAARYERGLYFSGVLNRGRINVKRSASQFFPYPVRDVYGAPVIPETLGNVTVEKYNQHGVRLPAEMLAAARRQLVVRDGFASFFYHPFLGLKYLPQVVEGLQKLGYTFVPARAAILR